MNRPDLPSLPQPPIPFPRFLSLTRCPLPPPPRTGRIQERKSGGFVLGGDRGPRVHGNPGQQPKRGWYLGPSGRRGQDVCGSEEAGLGPALPDTPVAEGRAGAAVGEGGARRGPPPSPPSPPHPIPIAGLACLEAAGGHAGSCNARSLLGTWWLLGTRCQWPG